MTRVVIAGYARSPFTPAKRGELASVRPDELAAQVVRALVGRSGIPAADIEDLLLGCAFPEGEQGFNVARLVGIDGRPAAARRGRHRQPLLRLVHAGGPHGGRRDPIGRGRRVRRARASKA